LKEAIRHDEEQHRFVIALRGQEALLAYSQKGNVLDFYRTFVLEGFRGRGLAEKIVKTGFDYAKQKGLKVLPTCPYVSGPFLKRHEEYRALVVDQN